MPVVLRLLRGVVQFKLTRYHLVRSCGLILKYLCGQQSLANFPSFLLGPERDFDEIGYLHLPPAALGFFVGCNSHPLVQLFSAREDRKVSY